MCLKAFTIDTIDWVGHGTGHYDGAMSCFQPIRENEKK